MNDVFILGAGFSRDLAGLPVMTELGEAVQLAISELPDSGTKKYLTSQVPVQVTANIETLVTYLEQGHPWRSAEENHLAAAGQVAVSKIIERLIREGVENAHYRPDALEAARSLIRHCHRWEDTIVTFNYDTLLELLAQDCLKYKSIEFRADRGDNFTFLKRLQIISGDDEPRRKPPSEIRITWDADTRELLLVLPSRDTTEQDLIDAVKADDIIPPDELERDLAHARVSSALQSLRQAVPCQNLYQIPLNNVASRTASLWSSRRARTLRLLKLHGSINWFYTGSSEYAGEQLYFSRPTSSVMNDASFSWNTADLVPVIIPPSLAKSSFYRNISLRSQWAMAETALGTATRVFVIGYSCPMTDFTTTFMLQRALRDRHVQVHIFSVPGGTEENGGDPVAQRYAEVTGGDIEVKFHKVGKTESSIAAAMAVVNQT